MREPVGPSPRAVLIPAFPSRPSAPCSACCCACCPPRWTSCAPTPCLVPTRVGGCGWLHLAGNWLQGLPNSDSRAARCAAVEGHCWAVQAYLAHAACCGSLLCRRLRTLLTHTLSSPHPAIGKGSWSGLNFQFERVRIGADPERQRRCDAFLQVQLGSCCAWHCGNGRHWMN